MKIRLEATLAVAAAAIVVAGCATLGTNTQTAQPAQTPLAVSDSLLQAHKGDLDGLYAAWIQPLNTVDGNTIQLASKDEQVASEAAVGDGITRFCALEGGAVARKPQEFGNEYRCTRADGSYVGTLTTTRFKGNQLYVTRESAREVAARAAREQEFERRRAKNGPSGWIVTDDGRYRFLRLGTLRERHLVEVELASDEVVPIEDVARIDLPSGGCCDLDVKLKDGRRKTVNTARLRHLQGPSMSASYGGGQYGLPVVIVDPISEQPATKVFSNLDGVKSIELDKATDDAQSAGLIKAAFEPASQARVDRYMQKLRGRANELYEAATKDGSIKMLPDGKLPPQLSEYLQNELKSIVESGDCKGDAVNGVSTMESLVRCRVAAKELHLIVGAGYSLVTSVTPLSSIIVLEKIKRDTR